MGQSISSVLKQIDGHPAHLPVALGWSADTGDVIRDLIDLPHLLISETRVAKRAQLLNNLIYGVTRRQNVRFAFLDPYGTLADFRSPDKIARFSTSEQIERFLCEYAATVMNVWVKRLDEHEAVDIRDFNSKHPHDRLPYHLVVIENFPAAWMLSLPVRKALLRLLLIGPTVGFHMVAGGEPNEWARLNEQPHGKHVRDFFEASITEFLGGISPRLERRLRDEVFEIPLTFTLGKKKEIYAIYDFDETDLAALTPPRHLRAINACA